MSRDDPAITPPPDYDPAKDVLRLSPEGRVVGYLSIERHEYEETSFRASYIETCPNDEGDPTVPMEGKYGDDIATISLKWDGCCHLGFRDTSLNFNWVHVCGPEEFERYMEILRWMWTTGQERISHYDKTQRLAHSTDPEAVR